MGVVVDLFSDLTNMISLFNTSYIQQVEVLTYCTTEKFIFCFFDKYPFCIFDKCIFN